MTTPKKILLVEDDPKFLYALQAVLNDHGHGVTAYSDAETVHLDGQMYDAAILDVRLPKKRGTDLARELRHRQKNIRIIFISAYDDLEQEVALLPGAAILAKPFGMHSLLKLLE